MKSMLPLCPLCRGSESLQKDMYSSILNLQGNSESNVWYCPACGAYYLWPGVHEDLISELYSKSYFTGAPESSGNLAVPSSRQDYETEFAADRVGKFHETVRKLISFSPKAKNILDIGAATGEFLAVARGYGLDTSGIELSAYAVAQAKKKFGFAFHQVSIVDYKGRETYDFIHMNHVFEHFGAPHQALERIASLLNSEGIVYVEVPFQFNVFEVIKYRLTGKRKDFDVFSVHHPIFYRPNTLKKIFRDHGFSCKSMRIFNWSRYPVANFSEGLKRLVWQAGSLFGQGIVIEAFFEKKRPE